MIKGETKKRPGGVQSIWVGRTPLEALGVLNMAWQQRPHSGSLDQQLVAVSICSNMDRPRGDHTKRGESDGERQTSYDITYCGI